VWLGSRFPTRPGTLLQDELGLSPDLVSPAVRPWSLAAGDQLRLRVLRDGEVRELSYEVTAHKLLVPTLHGVDGCTPTYFTIAGLIFVPLSIPFLEHAYGGALC